jgi:Rad3-related DNA helicase
MSEDTVELLLHELCETVGGVNPLGELPSEEFYACQGQSTLFPKGYMRNVSLCGRVDADGVHYELRGDADGSFFDGKVWTVDVVRMVDADEKIKTEWKSYGKLLGFLLAMREGAAAVAVRVIAVGRNGEGIKTFCQKVSFERLHGFACSLLSLIAFRIRSVIERERNIRPSADGMAFPYPEIREGQEQMIRASMSAIKKEKKLFVCAPTGIGKTMSALYPSVRAFGAGLCDKIFYLTAKNSTSLEAYRAAGKLFEAGARLKTIVLSAKETMCIVGGSGKNCNPQDCPLLKNSAERMRAAICELFSGQNGFYPAVIREVAMRHRVCAYELSLDLSELCDIIICDYNYLFDPMVHLKRYFDEDGRFGRYVFLLDEAHNLADRARAMYTAAFSYLQVKKIYEKVPLENGMLSRMLEPILASFDEARARCSENRRAEADGKIVGYDIGRERVMGLEKALGSFCERARMWLRKNREDDLYDDIHALSREAQRYLSILAHYDEKFITYIEEQGENVTVSLMCIDPSEVVGDCLSKARASVLFSATLAPIDYFADILGGDKSSMFLELASPYEQSNLCLAAVDSISTRSEDRDRSYKKTATYIAAAVSGRAGNYMAYFPSYSYLEKVYEAFCKKYPAVQTVVQKRGMNAFDREEFLSVFAEDTGKMRVGFAVLGGSFSEGVDLPGSRLIGSIIVGVGLPGFSSERNIMRDYFENRYENGFAYAYTYPGMNNVLQAAGRVIRRDEDKGIVVLIDDRYAEPTYQKLFPKHWKHLKYAGNPSSLAEIVQKFWEKTE